MGLRQIWVQDGGPGEGTAGVCAVGAAGIGSIAVETEVDVLFGGSAAVLEMTAEAGEDFFVSDLITNAIPFYFGAISCFCAEAAPPATLDLYARVSDEWATYPPLTIKVGQVSLLPDTLNVGTDRAYETAFFKVPCFDNEGMGTRSQYKFFFKMPSQAAAQMSLIAVVHGAFLQEQAPG